MTRLADRTWAARLLAAAALALALSGCFYQSPRLEEARAKAAAAFTGCDQQRQAGRLASHVAAVDCAAPTVAAAYSEAAYPYEDLVYIELQARRIAAAKLDAGTVTEDQYQHDLAELKTRLAAEDARRTALTSRSVTPAPEAPETLIAGLPAFAPGPAPVPLPPRGSCLPLGGIKSCP